MLLNKIISLDIQPFNAIWCMNCNDQMLVSVLQFYKINLINYFLNYIHYYNFIKNKNIAIGAGIIKRCETYKLLNECGIIQYEEYFNDNNQYKIKEYINTGCPLIAFIDCYYEPLRNDAYMKKHYNHAIIIYGYNDIECNFNIIEHEYYNSKKYLKTIISYNDFKLCQLGYYELNNFDYKTCSFIGFERNIFIKTDEKFIKEQYYEFLNEQKEVFYSSLTNLEYFMDEFEKLKDNLLLDNSEYIVTHLGGLINTKIFDLYKNDIYMHINNESLNNNRRILNYWNIFRGLTEKMNLKQQYNVMYHKKCIDLLRDIYELESLEISKCIG